MEILLPLFYLVIFLILISRMPFFILHPFSLHVSLGLFLLKIFAAIFVYLIYTRYYSSPDFIFFFNDARQLALSLVSHNEVPMHSWDSKFDPLFFNTSRTMIIINMLFLLFSFGNIYVHLLFFCFLSFCGLIALYKSFAKHFQQRKALMTGLFLLPSTLVWGSAPLKEAVLLFFLGFFVYFSDFGFFKNKNIYQVLLALLFFIGLFFIKPYVAVSILPCLIANYWISRRSNSNLILTYLSVFSIMAGLAFIVALVFPRYNALEVLADRQSKAIAEAKGGAFFVSDSNFIHVDFQSYQQKIIADKNNMYRLVPGSDYISWPLENMKDTSFISAASDTSAFRLLYIQEPAKSIRNFEKTNPDILSFLFALPSAALSVLFRPHILEMKTWLHYASAIENLILLLILMLSILFFKAPAKYQWPILAFALISSFFIFAVIGLTIPAFGNMVRYRIAGLVSLLPALLMIIDWQKIGKFLKFY